MFHPLIYRVPALGEPASAEETRVQASIKMKIAA